MKASVRKLNILFGAVKPYWLPYGASTMVVSLRNYALNMLNAMLFSTIAYAARVRDLETLKKSSLVFLLLLLLFVIVDTLSLHVQAITIHNMMVTVRQTLYHKFLRIQIKEVRASGADAGDILSRLNSDVNLVDSIFSMNLLYPLMLTISGIGGSVSIYQISPAIWLYLVGVGVIALFVKIYFSKKVYAYSKNRQMCFSRMMTLLNQLVANFPNIRVMNMTTPVIVRRNSVSRICQSRLTAAVRLCTPESFTFQISR